MGQKVDLRLAALLDEAETRTSCLVPANDADRKALDRRKPAEVICPRPGLYARRAKWELLKRHPDIRALMVVRGLATQHPDWVFAHVSAALAHGLQVSGRSLGKIHLATNQTAHTESSGQIVRHCVPDEELAECVSVGGVRVTSLLRTHGLVAGQDNQGRVLRLARHRPRTCGCKVRRWPERERRGVHGPGGNNQAGAGGAGSAAVVLRPCGGIGAARGLCLVQRGRRARCHWRAGRGM